MATLDPSIILSGQQPNFLAIAGGANQLAQAKIEDARRNALAALIQQQGPNIMAGDPQALNALATHDPQAALGIQQQRQSMQIDAATFAQQQKAAADATAQALKDSQDAAAAKIAAAEVEELKRAFMGGFGMYQSGDMAGLQAYIAQNGLDKELGVTPENYPYMAAMIKGVTEGIEAVAKMQPKDEDPFKGAPSGYYMKDPGDPSAGVSLLPGYTPPASSGLKVTTNPDGTMSLEQGPGVTGKPLTEAEGRNSGFFIRMRDSGALLDQFEDQGLSLMAKLKSKDPTGLANYLQSPEYLQFDQAKRDFVNALLRRESGAVISDAEFANAERQYFPQPGDPQEVVEQKRKNRENAIKGVAVGAGQGLNNPIVKGAGQGKADFKAMDIDQLLSVDVNNLTADEVEAMLARMKELGL